MFIFHLELTYCCDYEVYTFETELVAETEENAKEQFYEICSKNVDTLRKFLLHHPKLEGLKVVKEDALFSDYNNYFGLPYVLNNEHECSYKQYLGTTLPTEENYKEYLTYVEYYQDAYNTIEEHKSHIEHQQQYQLYVEEAHKIAIENNKLLVSDEFILDFVSKMDITLSKKTPGVCEIKRYLNTMY